MVGDTGQIGTLHVSLILDAVPFSFLGAWLAGCDWTEAGTFKPARWRFA